MQKKKHRIRIDNSRETYLGPKTVKKRRPVTLSW